MLVADLIEFSSLSTFFVMWILEPAYYDDLKTTEHIPFIM